MCRERQHVGRDRLAGIAGAFRREQLAQIARETASRGDRIAGSRTDDLRAAVRVEHGGVERQSSPTRFASEAITTAAPVAARNSATPAFAPACATAASAVSSGTTA